MVVSEREGVPVYTASLEAMPVTVEGETPAIAEEKLRRIVEHLAKTVGIPEEAFEKTSAAKDWKWDSYDSKPVSKAAGPDRTVFSLSREAVLT